MQKVIEFRDTAASGRRAASAAQPATSDRAPSAAPPSIEPIYAVVDSLSRTLECIKSLCATVPSGPMRDNLEIERTNLVIGLFVARIAAMRVTPSDAAPQELPEPKIPLARRG